MQTKALIGIGSDAIFIDAYYHNLRVCILQERCTKTSCF